MLKAWLIRFKRFSQKKYSPAYKQGYSFAHLHLRCGVSVRELLVDWSVGPDGHNNGLRDACSDLGKLYEHRVKKTHSKFLFSR